MRARLPLGAYVSASAPLARVDARVKLVFLLAWTAVLFAAPGACSLAAAYLALAGALYAARMRASDVARGVRPALVVLALVFCANAVALDGTASVPVAGAFGLDVSGALHGASMCLRIIALVGLALAVSASTTAPELADAFTRLLSPLARLGVPVGDVGLALSIALRFVPLISEELDRIVLAQRARGVRFDEGGIAHRLSRWASVVTPLAVGLFRRADALAESMDARAYGAGEVVHEARPLAVADKALLAGGCAAVVLVWVASSLL